MEVKPSARRVESMTILLTTRNGTGLARFRLRLTGESMQSGWIRVTLRTIPTRSSFIRPAWMAAIPGRPNIAISNSFNPFLGYPNQNKLGDYITVVSDNAGAQCCVRGDI